MKIVDTIQRTDFCDRTKTLTVYDDGSARLVCTHGGHVDFDKTYNTLKNARIAFDGGELHKTTKAALNRINQLDRYVIGYIGEITTLKDVYPTLDDATTTFRDSSMQLLKIKQCFQKGELSEREAVNAMLRVVNKLTYRKIKEDDKSCNKKEM